MNHHRTVKLKDVAEIERRGIDPSDIVEGTTYVGLEHIASGGESLSSATVDAGELGSNKFKFTSDHILYGKLRPYLAKIVAPEFGGVCSTDILPIRPGPKVDKRYLLHYLRLPEIVAWAAGRATGVNLPRLSPSELAGLSVPLPALDEQRRIAAILDKADALRQKRKRAIALLDSLTQSIFLEMFGDPLLNERAWPTATIGELLAQLDSGWSPVCLDRPATPDEWGVLKLSAVTSGQFVVSEQKALPPNAAPRPHLEVREGDILFTRKNTRELVAASTLVGPTRQKLMLSDLIFRLVPKANISPAFFHATISYPTMRKSIQNLVSGAAGSMPNISKEKLRGVIVIHPSRSLQDEFTARTYSQNRLRDGALRSMMSLDGLFSSLQHRVFSSNAAEA